MGIVSNKAGSRFGGVLPLPLWAPFAKLPSLLENVEKSVLILGKQVPAVKLTF